MKIKFYLLLAFFIQESRILTQSIGIGTSSPHSSAILELKSDSQGVIVPRMNTIKRLNIIDPAEALLVFDTDLSQFFFFNGDVWQAIGQPGGIAGGNLTGSYPNPLIADNAITSPKIVDGSIINTDLALHTLDSTRIQDNTINSAKIQDGTITNLDIAINSISGTRIQDNAITSMKIQDLSIVNSDIAFNTIDGSKIQDNAIGTGELDEGAVQTSDIKDGTIANNDIANNTITVDKINTTGTVANSILRANGSGQAVWSPSNISSLSDSDNDTKVEVEENADEDKIRLATNGVERMHIANTGNIGIGTSNPHASAALDITSTTQAFMPPRMTFEQMKAIPNPQAGMMVYDTEFECLRYYNGSRWVCSNFQNKIFDSPGSTTGALISPIQTVANSSINSCTKDNQGNIYIAGEFIDSVKYNGCILPGNTNHFHVFVMKLDTIGNCIWVAKSSGTGIANVTEIITDVNGNIYVYGSYFNEVTFASTLTSTNSEAFLAKLNPNGIWQWNLSTVSDNGNVIPSCMTTDSNKIYIAGTYGIDTLFMGTFPLYPSTTNKVRGYIAAINTNGTWFGNAISINDADVLSINALKYDAANSDIILAGGFKGIFDFQNDIATSINNSKDCFMARMDINFVPLFVTHDGGNSDEEIIDIEIIGNTIYSLAKFKDTFTLNETPNSYFLKSKGGTDVFLGSGNLFDLYIEHAIQLGGSEEEKATCLALAPNNSLLFGVNTISNNFTYGNLSENLIYPYSCLMIKVNAQKQPFWGISAGSTAGVEIYDIVAVGQDDALGATTFVNNAFYGNKSFKNAFHAKGAIWRYKQ